MSTESALFRNIEPINYGNDIIDEGSLWREANGRMVLVDDDRYVEYPITDCFVSVDEYDS